MAQPNSSGLWLIQAPTRRPPLEPPQIAILPRKENITNYLDGIFSSMWVQSLEELLLFVTPLKNRVHGIIENGWVYFISHLTKHKEINPLYIKSDSSDSQRILGRKTGFF